ncbi:MAG: DUF1887 family protein [Anaerolineae bacterium]|nr:DUF1887 family protein [Anaerolineae bacterium]
MSNKMVALMGEQPIPNLLPIRYDQPTEVLLVRTKRTEQTAARLARIIRPKAKVFFSDVDPYDISAIYQELTERIEVLGWLWAETVFNLTGGTKTMAFAAYQVAVDQASQFLYLESEHSQSRLRQYAFEHRLATLQRDTIIPAVITIDDYLRAYLDDYQFREVKEAFEQTLLDALKGKVDEIAAAVQGPTGSLDLDLVIRTGNQVGIVEAKTGRKAKRKEGIDQLNTAAGQKYLGTYTKKFLVVDASWEKLTNLRDLADARHVKVIELPDYGETKTLTVAEQQRLVQAIKAELGDA